MEACPELNGSAQVHYLSASPTSLAEALLTGGIPPNIDEPCPASSTYTRLFRWEAHCRTPHLTGNILSRHTASFEPLKVQKPAKHW